MTNREAAEIMKAIIFILKNDDYSDEVEEAIHMAINALKAQEKAQEVSNDSPELDKENGELISRQAAIEVLGVFTQTDVLGHTPKQIVEALPSAQPTQCNSGNILRHPQCANRTNLGNCDPVGGFCNSVPKEICDAQPQPEPQSRMVFGYSMEYLVAFAEACRRANVDESDLKTFANNCTFAYATMAEEYRQQIDQAIDAFMGNARGTNESD